MASTETVSVIAQGVFRDWLNRLCPTEKEKNTRGTKKTQKAQEERRSLYSFCFLCLLCSVPFSLGKSSLTVLALLMEIFR